MDRSAAPATAAMPVANGELTTTSPEQTRALGRALGAAAAPGDVVALIGPLGAG
jgi:ABC-type hemin transport system ATPase subunit